MTTSTNTSASASARVVGMSVPDLSIALGKGARANGDWDRIAATELIVAHESWLWRADFRRHITLDGQGGGWLNLLALAHWIDNSTGTRASSSETAIVRLACSLAGFGPDPDADPLIHDRWSLHSMLRTLGRVNSALAAEAVRYAALGPACGHASEVN